MFLPAIFRFSLKPLNLGNTDVRNHKSYTDKNYNKNIDIIACMINNT
jgi:hypothetical protein